MCSQVSPNILRLIRMYQSIFFLHTVLCRGTIHMCSHCGCSTVHEDAASSLIHLYAGFCNSNMLSCMYKRLDWIILNFSCVAIILLAFQDVSTTAVFRVTLRSVTNISHFQERLRAFVNTPYLFEYTQSLNTCHSFIHKT